MAQIIPNTATMSYNPVPNGAVAQVQATLNVQASGGRFDQAALAFQATPANTCIVGGALVPLTISASNIGVNPLNQAVVDILPPANGVLSGQTVLGQYTVQPIAGGGLRFSLTQPLAVATAITLQASLQLGNPLPVSGQMVQAVFSANGINGITTQSNTFIVKGRTPSLTQFMQRNPQTQQLQAARVYHGGETIWVQVQDPDQNIDMYTAETVQVSLTDNLSADSELMTLTETAPNSGVFAAGIPSVVGVPVVVNDGNISVTGASQLSAKYTDRCDATDSTAAATLVDPFGLIFSTADGSPINGATITIIDTTTGLPAQIFGDDGVSTYPATLTSGGTATDAAGTVYNFPPGGYRFPFAMPGSYRFLIQPPAGFTFPTVLTDANIQTLPGAPFALTVGSRGELFRINPGPALHIDIPMDAKGSALFVRKTAGATQVTTGDFVSYTVQVENTNPNFPATSVRVQDRLPPGFQYRPGTTVIDTYSVADPLVSTDGRTLQFDIYSIARGTAAQIRYVVEVGAGAPWGEATNQASATGVSVGVPVGSNTALATVLVGDNLMARKSLIVGRVFVDENDNGLNDPGEPGLAGVRIYMQDGTFITSDKDGHYHIEDIAPGTHVLQMDEVPARYTPAPLPNTRFAGNRMSQFVDAQPGAIVRANFRVLPTPPPSTPVLIQQTLSQDHDGDVWVDLHVQQRGGVPLEKYYAVYSAPDGWQLDPASAVVNGEPRQPEASMIGYLWALNPAKLEQSVRFRIQPLEQRQDGVKESVAYARFSAPGTPSGRTGMTTAQLRDESHEVAVQREFAMKVHFATLSAEVSAQDRAALDEIVKELQGLNIKALRVIGHTDDVRIAANHRQVFASNEALSQARAASIADYLGKVLQLQPDALHFEGRAGREPIASNDDEDGRASNRRAQIMVDAVNVHRSFSVALLKTTDVAEANAIGTWDEPTASADKPAAPSEAGGTDKKATEGILSFQNGEGVPHPINAIRVELDSRLTVKLLIDGQQVPNDRIGFKSVDPQTDKTLYTYIGVDMGDPGEHVLRLEGLGPFGNARFQQEVSYIRTGEVAQIRFLEAGKNVADGKTPVRIRVQLLDSSGEVIRARTEVEMRGGDLLPMPRGELYQTAEEANAAVSKTVMVEQDGWMSFKPTGVSGSHRISIGYNTVQRSIEVFVAPEYRDWIMVGLAEGKVGWQQIAGHVTPIPKQVSADRFYRDGKLAFFAKGQVKGEYLLTIAYDSSKTDGANRNRLQQYINPTQYYTIYGDVVQRQSDAASKKKLYLKLERDTFYAMFGDYDTGLSITELGRYVRTMNGVKSEFKGTDYGYTAFASQTNQSYVKDELLGNGTSGLYRLSRQNIITGSEKLRVETRDRFQSNVILNSVNMQRFVDYDIDYQAGTLYFKSPVNSRDIAMNPIYIVVEFESNDQKDQFLNAGGRAYAKPLESVEVGTTYVRESQLLHNNRVMAMDATVEVAAATEIKGEIARSQNGATPTTVKQANAYTLGVTHLGKKLSSKAYLRQMQDGFGIGQQQGSENGTRKVGGDIRYKLNDQWSVSTAAVRQRGLLTNNTRDTLNNQLGWQLKDNTFSVGVNGARDRLATGQTLQSRLFTTGGTARVSNRVTLQASREQALRGGTNSADYPTRTTAGATYMLTEKVGLDVAQEWTQGALQNSMTTRVGLKSSPWTGGQLLTRYEQSLNENGMRSFANIGMQQQWTVNDVWQLDVGLDRVQTLKHPGATAINPNVPLASGATSDFSAISLGANYSPQGWRWTNRIERRIAKTERSWSVSSGIQGEPIRALSTSLSTLATHNRAVVGTFQTSAVTSLGLAWRPDYDGLMLFDRLDVKYNASDNAVIKTVGWNYINNIHANWQSSAQQQWELHHGIQWSRQNINLMGMSSLTDFLFARWRYDFYEDWDFALQGALMHGYGNGQLLNSFGAAFGYNVMEDLWLSVGYNGHGFNARDFATAGYTTRGIYFDFRMKVDQTDIKNWLGHSQDAVVSQ